MKKSKLAQVVMLVLALSLTLASASWARPFGWGPGALNLTPEQAGQMFDLKQQFMNDTASIRKQLWVKRAEMRALWKAENPDEKAIQAKLKEISPLRDQLREKAIHFRLAAKKIAPQAAFGRGMGGCGMGPGGCGMGPGGGMGPGMGPRSDAGCFMGSGGDLAMEIGQEADFDGPGL